MVTFWFALVVLCWVLFFVLEGFDFGVGVLGPVLGRDDHERGAVVRTVGPFWDGNEVWLVAAIGVTFAAFPDWYAALLVRSLPADGRDVAAARGARGGAGVPRQGRRPALAAALRRGAGGQLGRHRRCSGAPILGGLRPGPGARRRTARSPAPAWAAASSPLLTPAGRPRRAARAGRGGPARRHLPGPAHHRPGPPPRPRWPRIAAGPGRCTRGAGRARPTPPASGAIAAAAVLALGVALLARSGRRDNWPSSVRPRRGRRGRRRLHRPRRRGAAQHPGPGVVADHDRGRRHRLRRCGCSASPA